MTRIAAFALACVIGPMASAQEADDQCGATGLQGLVGQTGEIAPLLVFEDRLLRIIVDNQPVTLDFRVERLNIAVEDGVIVSIRCG